jgi:hypothetical protein
MQIRRFNWFHGRSPYQQLVDWRQRRQAVLQNFQSTQSAASDTMFGAQINLSAGMVTLTAKSAAVRMQAQIQTVLNSAKLDTLA